MNNRNILNELLHANRELAFQHLEKVRRADELVIANAELIFQNIEKEKRAAELTIVYKKLKRSEKSLIEYTLGLKKMTFMTSHRVREPIVSIIGTVNLLDESISSPDELRILLAHIKQSAMALDAFTRELTKLMNTLEQKVEAIDHS